MLQDALHAVAARLSATMMYMARQATRPVVLVHTMLAAMCATWGTWGTAFVHDSVSVRPLPWQHGAHPASWDPGTQGRTTWDPTTQPCPCASAALCQPVHHVRAKEGVYVMHDGFTSPHPGAPDDAFMWAKYVHPYRDPYRDPSPAHRTPSM